LTNLGISLRTRFNQLENIDDLDDAIARQQAAITLTPDGHPSKPRFLTNLGVSLRTRFDRLENIGDLDDAIARLQEAVTFTPDNHPDKTASLISLSECLYTAFHQSHQLHYIEMAMHHLSVAAAIPGGPPLLRFTAAQRWTCFASELDHESLLSSFECAVGLIPLVAWRGLPIANRHQYLAQIGEIARDAAAVAISLEEYEKALEWLEQGRSVVWTQILHLRAPVDELREVDPDLTERLVQISRQIEQGSGQGGIYKEDGESMEEQAKRYRALTLEWESIVDQVRSLPDFEDFLRPRDSQHLMEAAVDGPIVVLNVAVEGCDALAIVPGEDDIIHIPLPNVTSERVTELQDKLKDFLHSKGVRSRGERGAIKFKHKPDKQPCEEVLAELWNNLVHPILNSLTLSVRAFYKCMPEIAKYFPSSLIQMSFRESGGVPLDH
jgi:tetratricopeptide (TPR) repeat protein